MPRLTGGTRGILARAIVTLGALSDRNDHRGQEQDVACQRLYAVILYDRHYFAATSKLIAEPAAMRWPGGGYCRRMIPELLSASAVFSVARAPPSLMDPRVNPACLSSHTASFNGRPINLGITYHWALSCAANTNPRRGEETFFVSAGGAR